MTDNRLRASRGDGRSWPANEGAKAPKFEDSYIVWFVGYATFRKRFLVRRDRMNCLLPVSSDGQTWRRIPNFPARRSRVITDSNKGKGRTSAARVVVCAAFCVASGTVQAQEFSLLAGPLRSGSQNTYSWEANYREGLGRYVAWSFSWLNEGHIPDHHRDGQALQIWGRLPLWDDRLELSAGAGPYRYFDTSAAQAGGRLRQYARLGRHVDFARGILFRQPVDCRNEAESRAGFRRS